jgi:hypothetical protein
MAGFSMPYAVVTWVLAFVSCASWVVSVAIEILLVEGV